MEVFAPVQTAEGISSWKTGKMSGQSFSLLTAPSFHAQILTLLASPSFGGSLRERRLRPPGTGPPIEGLGLSIASYRAFIALHRKSDAGPRIASLASDCSIQCISIASAKRCNATHYNLVASVCIAFRYDADAMHRFCDAMHHFFDAIPIHGYLSHRIASFHRCFT
ncbi:hypothetical protein PGT21_012206 [Puccinia graminis f. sp. tritici]|uniref:Uncharacterized protein n=1 Tax=Puccinia graminis f. sp. tritici TaxID=56615 RepID=A0A5B0NZM9_PUCGR|nr:hypothetical protein PGTUg99_029073 [Puccinia graminis f. sp. tritici]KAA1094176.1 hypothetical protein PGT21_012206 [Puccinia graminis f. sp. tritici]